MFGIQSVLERPIAVLKMFDLSDLLDIVIVAFLVYHLIRLLRETRSGQLFKGVFLVVLLYGVASAIPLRLLRNLMASIITYGFIALLVLFQPELRRILEQIGRSQVTSLASLRKFLSSPREEEKDQQAVTTMISAVCDSCANFSKERIGALIVLEKTTLLGDIIATGTTINATPSFELIKNIFWPKTPLHDGALIIRDGRLIAAGCFLPLSQNYEISRTLGTRHRAALGMSENSDAVVVIVSEETGAISIAKDGKLQLRLTVHNVHDILTKEFVDLPAPTEKKKIFRRGGKNEQL